MESESARMIIGNWKPGNPDLPYEIDIEQHLGNTIEGALKAKSAALEVYTTEVPQIENLEKLLIDEIRSKKEVTFEQIFEFAETQSFTERVKKLCLHRFFAAYAINNPEFFSGNQEG